MPLPPDDPSSSRADAAAALLAALRDVRDAGDRLNTANERLQSAAAWTLEAFGDSVDAETIRMLPVGGPARPGKPPVPGTVLPLHAGGVTVGQADELDRYDDDRARDGHAFTAAQTPDGRLYCRHCGLSLVAHMADEDGDE